jgi:histidine triad (HIT) family protein
MENCIFCKIIAGDIQNYTVYEDDHCLAFLDIHPVTKGHTVVIPKVHAETLLDLNSEITKEFFAGVKCALEKVETALSPDGFNVGWNQGDAGGQAVKHLHVHILPRWDGDAGGSMHSIVKKTSDTPVEELAKLF